MVTLVRPMAPEDVAAVLAIEIEANPLPWKEADFQAFVPRPESGSDEAADGHQKRAWVCVDPVVRGFICAVAVAGEAEVQSLGVARKFWGQGMGGALIQAVSEWARC